MDNLTFQLDQLRSPSKNRRYDACEQLRIASKLPLEAITALEQVSKDPDPDVADAASRALLAHKQDESYVVVEVQNPNAATTPADNIAITHAAMLKEIRSWGFWSLGLGAMHIIASRSFSAPWGILLLVVGLASFYFRTASMFIVYAVILTWVAISNSLSGISGWIIFAVLQLYLAVRIFLQYRRFRHVENEMDKLTSSDAGIDASIAGRSARFFPWIGSLLSCSSIAVFAVVFAAAIIIGLAGSATTFLRYLGFIGDVALNFGVLGFAVGLASWLSGYRPKALAIVGTVTGFLLMALNLIFIFLLRASHG